MSRQRRDKHKDAGIRRAYELLMSAPPELKAALGRVLELANA